MDASNELLLQTTLNQIQDLGLKHRGTRVPYPSDTELWLAAQAIAPDLFPGTVEQWKTNADADAMTWLYNLIDAYDQGRHREPDQRDATRLEAAVEKGLEGLWAAFAAAYPEITTGDFGPGETLAIEQDVKRAFESMLHFNRPLEGLAATPEELDRILAGRRDAAIARVTPMLTTVDVGDLIHEALQDDARDRAAAYKPEGDNFPDWIVWKAIHERAEELAEQTHQAGPAAQAALLVDLLGEYQAVRKLIDAADGALCGARTDDGLCGAPSTDGQCGAHKA